MRQIFNAVITSGSYDDYMEVTMFSSFNEEMVNKWVKRYNNIIEVASQRSINYYKNENFNQEPPFLAELIFYSEPKAILTTTEFRE